jgi:VWFA-related protein
MRISRRGFLAAMAGSLFAQAPDFSGGVDVVTVLATVRDRDGRIAKDLNAEDFVLLDDGVPQTIRYFARESGLPLVLGLLVDTSRSQHDVLEPEREASYVFLDQVLRPDRDKAFIAQFNTRVEVIQGFTSSREELRAALDRLRIPGMIATLLFEAVKSSSEHEMRPEHGRKAFIILSDGVSFRDKTTIGTAIEYAQRADTIIYSILFAEPVKVYRPGKAAIQAVTAGRGRSAMQRLARETGGAYFEISQNRTLENAYAEIEEALRNQYSIGYTPTQAGKAGEYHKIKLAAKRPGLVVQTREGYYSK